MKSAESDSPNREKLPVVTRAVIDELDLKGYNMLEAVRLMEETNPVASECLAVYIDGMSGSHSESMLAYHTAAYLYTLLHEAQNNKDSL
jgi:hypothetical protein